MNSDQGNQIACSNSICWHCLKMCFAEAQMSVTMIYMYVQLYIPFNSVVVVCGVDINIIYVRYCDCNQHYLPPIYYTETLAQIKRAYVIATSENNVTCNFSKDTSCSGFRDYNYWNNLMNFIRAFNYTWDRQNLAGRICCHVTSCDVMSWFENWSFWQWYLLIQNCNFFNINARHNPYKILPVHIANESSSTKMK